MRELSNCERCNAVFVKVNRAICPDCFRKEEEDFRKVYQFLAVRKNREATVQEINEATGVKEEMIFKFLKEGRLTASNFPNLSYPCERCGQRITEGKICVKCQKNMQVELERHEKEKEERKLKKKKEEQAVYFAFDQRKEK